MIEGQNSIKNKYRYHHFLIFIPLLILYLLIVLVFAKSQFQADESGYIGLAESLLEGHYGLQGKLTLWWGPGYPIILVPFVWFELPLIIIKILNAVLLYLSVILFFKTLLFYVSNKTAIISAYLFGLYFPMFKMLPLIMTEIFAIFIICALIFSISKMFQNHRIRIKHILLPALLLGYLALTKVIFGYVILATLIFLSISFIFLRSDKVKSTILLNAFALLFCVPYLLYTYSITNKVFYWSNAGGNIMYWLSSPYPEESGSPEFYPELNRDTQLYLNHHKFFDEISDLDGIEWDKALKKQALENIKSNPGKFLKNWTANIGRLLFSYPFSYGKQSFRTYFTLFPNMFIVVFAILLMYPTIRMREKIPYEILFLLVFAAIYFFGSSLLSAVSRYFYIIIPIIGLWFSYMFGRVIKIKYK